MAVSDSPWQFSQGDYSPEQWARACLIDTGEGATDSKERYKLPVLEPSGSLNRNGVHAAAARINQVTGVSAEVKAAAARKLMRYYGEIGGEAPDSLKNIAGEGGRSLERLFVSTLMDRGKGFSPVEMRSTEKRTIGGYGSVFDSQSQDLGGFGEIVDRQFFNKTLADGAYVISRYNHNDDYLLGTTRSRTLRLTKDNIGLSYEVDLPECRGDVWEYVGRGDVANSSFAFQCFEEDWRSGDGGYPIRVLLSGKLIEVGPVNIPAYWDSTVGLRSLARHVGAPIEDVVKKSECNELRSFFVRTDKAGKPTPKKPTPFGPAALMQILDMGDDPISGDGEAAAS